MSRRTERFAALVAAVALVFASRNTFAQGRPEEPRAALPFGYASVDAVFATARWEADRDPPCAVLESELRLELTLAGLDVARSTDAQRTQAARRLLAQCLLLGLSSRVNAPPPGADERADALTAAAGSHLPAEVLTPLLERRLRALGTLDGLPDAPAVPGGHDAPGVGARYDDPLWRRMRLQALWSVQSVWLESWLRALGARVQFRYWLAREATPGGG